MTSVDLTTPEPAQSGDGSAAGLSRRAFLTGAALTVGAVLWSSGTPAGAGGGGAAPGARFLVGRGLADCTGEPFGAGMNGYAVPRQTSVGLQRRQFARAFVVASGAVGATDPSGAGSPAAPAAPDRLVHVTVDTGLMFQSIQVEVLRRLRAEFGDLYGEHNVILQATHTHVAPGGTSGHAMVDLTTAGFRPLTFEATVSGIVTAVRRAHADLAPSELTLTRTVVEAAGVNRSPQAFARNPEADRAANPDGVDRTAVTLHVTRSGRPVGLLNWYALHATTFGPEYRHISGDNKGYAAWATEHGYGVDHRHPGDAPFVAAFAQSAPGDVTPNAGHVPGSGPGADEAASARILGERIRAGATAEAAARDIATGGVDGRHRWVDMTSVTVDGRWTPDGRPGRTGPAILGAAFAASSQEDGGGEPALGFAEGERGGTPWVRALDGVLVPPDVAAVHAPKEMLLPVGYIPGMVQQTHWFAVHRVGALVLVSVPFEPTTTAGLRLRRTVAAAAGVDPALVVVQGYVNGYGHYLTTPEEYDNQDYEGGATVFGRLQLPAVQQIVDGLARDLAAGRPVDTGRPEDDLTGRIPASPVGVPWWDVPPPGRRFGDVLSGGGEVRAGETARVVADDSSESTLLTFEATGPLTRTTVEWSTVGVRPGHYRVRLRGDARGLDGTVTPFDGVAEVDVV
ncbi:neutral/alkaline non-lysosomal ceramidase N-terminal domain-containing protein [Corynebacterium bovis]|uniref:neutral/alkaline non-lysosomal ceramidase N-terminal domain-containing protein n=1 Tax=Corynebacterium bovis TaxID=36808 RepID=UPI00264CE988|nr:neutral/alkaline non-lysosomal ceramidase N-terminal domain-containing protein [Corynebacterium bovis]MDN8578589.1 neutral/alkaline non-lysosomal ceramidase N-terminal domain-containing protein [Corynebacterium bovis]